jgi:GDP-L-fucose synthase
MGWQPTIDLAKGLELTYQWFIEHQANFKSH